MARDNAEDGGDFIFGKNEQQQQSTVYMKGDKVVVFCRETFSPAMFFQVVGGSPVRYIDMTYRLSIY